MDFPSVSSAMNGNGRAAAAPSGTSDASHPLKRRQSPAEGPGTSPAANGGENPPPPVAFTGFYRLGVRALDSPVLAAEARADCARGQSLCNTGSVQTRALLRTFERHPSEETASKTRLELHLQPIRGANQRGRRDGSRERQPTAVLAPEAPPTAKQKRISFHRFIPSK